MSSRSEVLAACQRLEEKVSEFDGEVAGLLDRFESVWADAALIEAETGRDLRSVAVDVGAFKFGQTEARLALERIRSAVERFRLSA